MTRLNAFGLAFALMPLLVSSLNGQSPATIAANESMALCVENGQAYSWGSPLDGSGAAQLRPTPLSLAFTPLDISAGARFALFLLPNGQVWGGGVNGSGELGRGFPGLTQGLAPATAVPASIGIAASVDKAYAWTANGTLFGWGDQIFLGAGIGNGPMPTPQQIAIPTVVVDVASAWDFSLALDDQGQVWGWGQISLATASTYVPVPIQGLPPIQEIAVGGSAGYAVSTTGQVFLLSSSAFLSPGSTLFPGAAPAVTAMTNLPLIRSVAASQGVAACLDFSGNVWVTYSSFPINGFLSAPVASTPGITNPVQVPGLEGIVEITANRSLYARDATGTLWVVGPSSSLDGLGLGASNIGVARPARVPMTGPVPSVTVSAQPAPSPACLFGSNLTPPPSLPALGGEITVQTFSPVPPLLFAAAGPATAPQALPSGCTLFLDVSALTNYLNAGIGPFPPVATPNPNPSLQSNTWVFPIPDSPALAGFTISTQSAWLSTATPSMVELGPAHTFVIN